MSVEHAHMNAGSRGEVSMQRGVSPKFRFVRVWCVRLMPAAGLETSRTGGVIDRRTSRPANGQVPCPPASGISRSAAPSPGAILHRSRDESPVPHHRKEQEPMIFQPPPPEASHGRTSCPELCVRIDGRRHARPIAPLSPAGEIRPNRRHAKRKTKNAGACPGASHCRMMDRKRRLSRPDRPARAARAVPAPRCSASRSAARRAVSG